LADSFTQLKKIIEGLIMASEKPLSINQIIKVLNLESPPSQQEVKNIIFSIAGDYQGRGIQLKEVASGYRFQVSEDLSPWVQKLWQERPPKYSRALLETLALIVYRQPITRAEIEEIRGVAVSTNIIKTLMAREWIKVVGHKEVPGRPVLYATTKEFLNYFNLKALSELPTLLEIQDTDVQKLEMKFKVELQGISSIQAKRELQFTREELETTTE